jgi:hypothetical protein
MYEEIKRKLLEVSDTLDRQAVFHYQVLKYANALAGDDPAQFCADVGMPESYADEFCKIIQLSEVANAK